MVHTEPFLSTTLMSHMEYCRYCDSIASSDHDIVDENEQHIAGLCPQHQYKVSGFALGEGCGKCGEEADYYLRSPASLTSTVGSGSKTRFDGDVNGVLCAECEEIVIAQGF